MRMGRDHGTASLTALFLHLLPLLPVTAEGPMTHKQTLEFFQQSGTNGTSHTESVPASPRPVEICTTRLRHDYFGMSKEDVATSASENIALQRSTELNACQSALGSFLDLVFWVAVVVMILDFETANETVPPPFVLIVPLAAACLLLGTV